MNPLRRIANLFKAVTSAQPYLGATANAVMPGYGTLGYKRRPIGVDRGVKSFAGWCFVAADMRAKAFATQTIRLYVRKRTGRKLYRTRPVDRRRKAYLLGDALERPSRTVLAKMTDLGSDFEEVTETHPAMTLLSTVNSWQNGFELSYLRNAYLTMTGNAYLHPVMNGQGGTPGELWMLPSQWVEIVPGKGDELVDGYLYGKKPNQQRFASDEVIPWRRPSLSDPYYGLGCAEAVWSAICLSGAKRTEDLAIKENFSKPDWFLGVEGAGPDALKQIEAKIEEKFRGTNNRGKMLATSGKVTATALNLPVGELGDPERIIEEIAAGFGVPISKLLANDPNRANAETGDAGFLRDTILPDCRLDEEQLNARYLTLWELGEDAVLAYDNPVPADWKQELEKTKAALGGAPYLAVNELREDLGKPPIDGGDKLMVPTTLAPFDAQPGGPLAGLFSGMNLTAPDATAGGAGSTPPVADPAAALEQPGDAQQIQTTEATVLNGAQVTAAASIVAQVTAGDLPRDSGVAMLTILFNLTPEKAESMMGSAGKPDVPTTPNPNPAAEAAQQAAADAAAANVPPKDSNAPDANVGEGKGIHEQARISPRSIIAVRQAAEEPTKTHDGSSPLRDEDLQAVPNLPRMRGVGQHVQSVVKTLAPTPDINSTPLLAPLREVFTEQLKEVLADHKLGKAFRTACVTKDDDRKPTKPPAVSPEGMPYRFIDLAKWDQRLADAVKPVIEVMVRSAAKAQEAVLIRAGASPDVFAVVDKNLPQVAENLSLKLAESTNATTSMQLNDALGKLRQEISEGIIQGDTVAEMKARVQTVFEQASDSRAETIARTEASRARHTAEQVTVKESGVVKKKMWLLSADACPECDALAAATADGVAVDQPFTTTSYGPVDGPPLHPNCTCSCTYVLDESRLQQPEDGQ